MAESKTAYICGPLTELDAIEQIVFKLFYEQIADVYRSVTGVRAFVPHEHYDPEVHAHFTPSEVDSAERRQVCEMTTIMIVVAIAPSWGGGIEVEMANSRGVPVVILHARNKRISRLLRGNPAIIDIIPYDSEDDALIKLRKKLEILFSKCVSAKAR